jgi:CRP-like cAMP-binding protein
MPPTFGRRDPLSDLPLFSHCTPAQIAAARRLVTQLMVPAGTAIISEGRFGYEFVIIADGSAEVSTGSGPAWRRLALLEAGNFAGEMSLLGRERRSATVTALTPLTIYVCNMAEFAGLLEIDPSIAEAITRAAAERRDANQRLAA